MPRHEPPAIEVLRLGHRPQRDKRITTHVCLTARALGARAVHIAEADPGVRAAVEDVARRFGGSFSVTDGGGWKGLIRRWQEAGGQVVHLTMYGQDLSQGVEATRSRGTDVLVVVGAEKVPAELYTMADENVSVGSQPHSEVAALAVFLDRLQRGAWEQGVFDGGTLHVVPQRRGKRVVGATGDEA